jgi:ZIP family zinc transporter
MLKKPPKDDKWNSIMIEFDPKDVALAFGLTLFAGLATGIGSALAFFGVMIYVSMIEIFIKAKDALCEEWGPRGGYWATTLAFFGGIAVIGLIDKLVPSFENPHEIHDTGEMEDAEKAQNFKKLHRMGLFTAWQPLPPR